MSNLATRLSKRMHPLYFGCKRELILFRGKKMSVDDFLNGNFMEGSEDEVSGDEVGILMRCHPNL